MVLQRSIHKGKTTQPWISVYLLKLRTKKISPLKISCDLSGTLSCARKLSSIPLRAGPLTTRQKVPWGNSTRSKKINPFGTPLKISNPI